MDPFTIEIGQIMRSNDWFAAIERIERDASCDQIADRYRLLVSEFYWKAHDLEAVTVLGRAGIAFCLGQSVASGTAVESAQRLRSIAKGLAYDVGSFTWPGWEEPGITPTPEDLKLGRECAKLNLRLAIELKKPLDRVSMAHWLVGAHALASRDFALASEQFRMVQEVLAVDEVGAGAMRPLNEGYSALARLCRDPNDGEARERFEEIVSALRMQKTDDAEVYLTQLVSARRVFVEPRPLGGRQTGNCTY